MIRAVPEGVGGSSDQSGGRRGGEKEKDSGSLWRVDLTGRGDRLVVGCEGSNKSRMTQSLYAQALEM